MENKTLGLQYIVQNGQGKIEPNEIPDIIEKKDRTKAGKTLPAHGLYLVKVQYK